jgi:hypothetical protein
VRLAELRMKKLLDEKSMVEGAKEEGSLDSKREDIIAFLSDLGDITEDLKKAIYYQTDMELLKTWVKLAARCESI